MWCNVIPGSSKKTANQLEVWRGEFDTPWPQFQCCVTAVLRGAFKKNSHSCSGQWEAMVSNIETGGSGGFRWMLQLLVDGCFFWRTRGLFFRLMDVHLLTWANVMLYFQQLLHADVTSSKCRPQRNGMSTCQRGQVACCTLTTSACRCDLIKIAARDSGSSTATHCLWTKPGCACQKPTVIKAAAGQHWFPCEFPCNARATHVQHTCNTTCNTSTFTVNLQVRLPFLVRLLQSFFVSIWKRRSACNGKKTQCYL